MYLVVNVLALPISSLAAVVGGATFNQEKGDPPMAAAFQSQPIQTDAQTVAMIATAWEMTKLHVSNRTATTAANIREEFKKNYKAVYDATNNPSTIED